MGPSRIESGSSDYLRGKFTLQNLNLMYYPKKNKTKKKLLESFVGRNEMKKPATNLKISFLFPLNLGFSSHSDSPFIFQASHNTRDIFQTNRYKLTLNY